MKMSKCHRQSHILIDLYQNISGLSADGHNTMVLYVCYDIDYDRAQIWLDMGVLVSQELEFCLIL